MAAAAPPPEQRLAVDFKALSYISSLVEALRAFDSDSDGLVTAQELRGLVASLGLDKSEAEVSDMLARGDADRDDRLSVEELLHLMNAEELGLGALGARLQSALPQLEALVGADELARTLGALGCASTEDWRLLLSAWMATATAPSPSRCSGSWPTCSWSSLQS